MSIEDNKALVRHAIDLWNERELDKFYELLVPGYIEHLPTGDISLEQLKQYSNTFFAAFPDIHFTIEHIVAEGDKVAVLLNWKATHKGEYMGIAPTGNKIDISVAMLIKITHGKWVEFWNITDIGLMQQLGANPRQ